MRANDRLMSECLRNGMCNYYVDNEPLSENYYGRLALLVINTLLENKNGALGPDDITFFSEVHRCLEPDRVLKLRISALEQKEEELTESESAELERLFSNCTDSINWEAFGSRAERCIANWCIANPDLVDVTGKSVEERGGIRNLDHLFNPPPPPPKCPLCNGRGFIQPETASGFPKRCTCQGPDPRTLRY